MRRARVKDGHGQPVLGNDLKPKTASRLFKTQEALDYQDGIIQICRAAKPSDFRPKDQIIVGYQFYFARSMDSDNAMKMLNDAVAKALGVNDSTFLPVTLHKQTGVRMPHVTVLVFDASHWFATVSSNGLEGDLATTGFAE